MRKESVDVDILVTPKNGDRKNQFDQFWRTSTKVIPIEKTKLATFQRWAKGSREAASEGPTALRYLFL